MAIRSRWWFWALFIVLVVAALIGGRQLVWIHVQHRFAQSDLRGAVFQSGVIPPDQLPTVLKAHGIRTVIDLRQPEVSTPDNPVNPGEVTAEQRVVRELGLRYENLDSPQVPSEAIVDRFLEIVKDPANRPVLIHCHHGTGRTELFVALYRIEFEQWDNEQARQATRFAPDFSSFACTKPKGAYLLNYKPRLGLGGSATAGALH